MFVNRFIKTYLIIASFAMSQSIFNGYGLGLSRTSFHSSVNGAGSIGLVPSFHPGVSMDNTATWPGLNFTYISGSFSNQANGTKNTSVVNQAARFNKLQFVIPIRERYGLGLSVKPLNNHNSFFTTDTMAFNFDGKDIFSRKEFRSGGGIMEASLGLALPLNSRMGLGISINHLFGSSRDEQSAIINNTYYRMFNLRTYTGSTFDFDFAGQLYNNNNLSISTFARVGLTNKPVSGKLYKFNFYEDSNNSYSFDTDDYPGDLVVDTTSISNIYSPNSFSFGLNVGFKNDLNIFSEFQMWNDEATNTNYASIFNDQIGSKFHFGGGMIRFGNLNARAWQDQITFRLGAYQDKYSLRYSGNSLIENGISIGFGFKFATTGNQIDFSFRNGTRSITEGQKELFKEITIGVSLGDMWFLRRRAKQ
jgi:hypothetical protein|tara:strand:+ start:3739 stop:4998 length:1260 start_codon:yes stop_codon:yes gene_type:complete